jgi:hypothetical protein
MTRRTLPFEAELQSLLSQKDGEKLMLQARDAAFLETVKTPGFQLVTALLRDLDSIYMNSLRSGTHPRPERLLGRLEGLEEIRRSLEALLPTAPRPSVDWFMDEDNVFLENQTRNQ